MIAAVAQAAPAGPFKGLTPFDDTDRDAVLFFGREREREVIAANLLASRLTVLYGASGVGKSSVLRAGVAHHLRAMARRNLETRGHPEFVVVVFDSWTLDPMAALLDAVQTELVEVFGPELAPSERAATPTDTLHEWTGRLDCDLLLVLDQTEEYFLYHEHEEGPGTFAGELPDLVTRPGLRVSALLAIRDDALARLDRFKGRIPNLFANYLRLDHLDKRAGRAAILGPIEQYNALAQPASRAAIEPALVETLLDETTTGRVSLGARGRGVVRQSGGRARVEAPYLQLVLHRLWEEELAAGSTLLRLETLERLGGANEVVRTHLERALEEFPTADKDIAADVFSHLVTPSGAKIAHGLHDLATYAHVGEDRLEPIVSRLVHERILRPVAKRANGSTNGAAEEAPYEIFHDVLGEAVLDWRTRHESERRVAEERAESDRRHRRTLAVLAIAFVALAAMTTVAAYAVTKRNEAHEQAARATQAAAFAELQRENAEQQEAKALAAEANAVEQRDKAQAAEEDATAQSQRAQEQEAAAVAGQAEAEHQRSVALDERTKADLQASRAVAARADADRQRRRAVRERTTAVRQRRLAEARLYLARAQAALEKDPRTTLGLALTAVSLEPLPQAEKVLRDGLLALRVRAVLRGGKGPLAAAVFSPDGSRVATASESGEARVFRTNPAALLQRLPHGSPLTSIAFSPDGRLVATAAVNGSVRIWDLASATSRPALSHGGRVRAVEFSPDGRLLATASNDRTARIWDVASGLLLRSFEHPQPVRSAHFSPDGALIVTAPVDRDPFARVFDVAGGPVAALAHPGAVTDARFSPNGSMVVSSGRRNIFVWQRGTWRQRHVLAAHVSPVHGVSISPDSSRAVSFDDSGIARVWRLDTGALIPGFIRHENSIDSAVFSPDSSTVLTASSDLTARIWTGDLSVFLTPLLGHLEAVSSASFSPDGTTALTASDDGTARLWRTATEPTLDALGSAKHTGGATSIDTSADGRLVASGGADGKVLVWRSRGGLVRTIEHGARVTAVVFTADGARVLSAGENGLAHLWRVRDGRKLASVAHGAPVHAAALSAAGRWIVTAGGTTARIWSSRGAPRHVLRHDGAVTSLALTPDGRRLVTGSADEAARLWNVTTGDELRVFRGHTGAVVAVAFSANGSRVATASADSTARVWNMSSSSPHTLEGHTEALTSVRFSPDGRRVVTASIDGQVRNWPVSGSLEPVAFRGHVSVVADARFSPDGRWVVTAGPSAAGMFVAESGERVYFLRGHGAPLTGALFTRGSRRILTSGSDGTVRTYLCGVCGGLPELRKLARQSLASVVSVG
jgi:WD40 repeat protein